MQRVDVISSNIKSIGYDEKSSILEVEFLSTDIYNYFDVPKAVYLELMESNSHGKYLNSKIKGYYEYKIIYKAFKK